MIDSSTIVLAHTSETLLDLYEYWLEGATTRRATTVDELETTCTPQTIVAVVGTEFVSSRREEVLKVVFPASPYCQVLLVLDRDSLRADARDRYDGVIREPMTRDDFRRAVKDHYKRGLYLTLLNWYYVLNARDQSATDRDDASDARISDRLPEVERRLENLKRGMDEEDFHQVVRALDLRKRLSIGDHGDVSSETAGKRPRECPTCKRGDEDNDGATLVQIASDVWECKRCGTVVKGAHGSNPWVT